MNVRHAIATIPLLAMLYVATPVSAGPVLPPGDLLLRHDLQLLNDSGITNVPLTTWPLSVGDLNAAIRGIDRNEVPASAVRAFDRVRDRVRRETRLDSIELDFDVSASIESRFIRTFQDTPRDEGEIGARLSWTGERFAFQVGAVAVANPFDGDEVRPDDTYVGVALGNWMLTAGWQQRWWGPGRDGSLILSSNARPAPGIMLQRNHSIPFDASWLRWIGPWSLTTFLSELDDRRTVRGARLFGIRGSFRPPNTGLEIGVTRTAQWCGDGRPCDAEAFFDLLVGNDNRGVNVDPDDEPGNQLGGFDIRWRLPKQAPAALYMQWIGEDGRGGGEGIGSWLRQLGAEYWGEIGSVQHRTHFEVSDSTCRQGGFGFSDKVPGCAYHHSIYTTGYRYQGRALAHGADGDSLSYSLGSTLVQSSGHSWDVSLRRMKINREGSSRAGHTISPVPLKVADIQISHHRRTSIGSFSVGVGFERRELGAETSSDLGGFLRWSSDR